MLTRENGAEGINLNVNLKDAETIKCPVCESMFFREVMIVKRLTKFLTGAVTDIPAPVPIWRCDDCGEPLREFVHQAVGGADVLFGKETEE